METKYLSDGRKVVIIGNLNQQEVIVQEVFVSDSGDELPSGERFVVKSVHDAPVKSYKKKEEERQDAALKKIKVDIDNAKRELREAKMSIAAHKDIAKNNLLAIESIKCFSDSDLDLISSVMTGNVKWCVDCGYNWYKPQAFSGAVYEYDGYSNYGCETRKYEGIKMITMMGVSRGKFRFNLNSWSDGSGGDREVKFFKDDESLKRFLRQKLESVKDEVSVDAINCLSSFIGIPQEVLDGAVQREKELAKNMYDNALEAAKKSFETAMNKISSK